CNIKSLSAYQSALNCASKSPFEDAVLWVFTTGSLLFFQFGSPPLRIYTLSKPMTLNIHQALGLEYIPQRSYRTTVLSLLIPSCCSSCSNTSADTSVCGS